MTKEEVIHDWVEQSDMDLPVMESLFSNGHYVWALFVGHLVVEKLLKAYYVKKMDVKIPRSHNLTKIAAMAGLELSNERKLFLEEVTTFNLEARYSDYKQRFHKVATKDFAEHKIAGIKEVRQWLLQLINN